MEKWIFCENGWRFIIVSLCLISIANTLITYLAVGLKNEKFWFFYLPFVTYEKKKIFSRLDYFLERKTWIKLSRGKINKKGILRLKVGNLVMLEGMEGSRELIHTLIKVSYSRWNSKGLFCFVFVGVHYPVCCFDDEAVSQVINFSWLVSRGPKTSQNETPHECCWTNFIRFFKP